MENDGLDIWCEDRYYADTGAFVRRYFCGISPSAVAVAQWVGQEPIIVDVRLPGFTPGKSNSLREVTDHVEMVVAMWLDSVAVVDQPWANDMRTARTIN